MSRDQMGFSGCAAAETQPLFFTRPRGFVSTDDSSGPLFFFCFLHASMFRPRRQLGPRHAYDGQTKMGFMLLL